MASPSFAPRPSTAPRETVAGARARASMGDLVPGNPSIQQTGAVFEAEYNPPTPPAPVTYLGLTMTQWLVLGAVGFTVYYFRKPIWKFVGDKFGMN